MIVILAGTGPMKDRLGALINTLEENGEKVEVWVGEDVEKGNWEPPDTCHRTLVETLAGYYCRNSNEHNCEVYIQRALRNYTAYMSMLEDSKPEMVLLWGGSNKFSRPLIYACREHKIPQLSMETPVLPNASGNYLHNLFMTPGFPYYEVFNYVDNGEVNDKKLDDYITWWKGSRQTKGPHKQRTRFVPLPTTWENTSRVVLFDQVPGDAASIWQGGKTPFMLKDCLDVGAWVKTHPLDPRGPCIERYGLSSLDPSNEMDIHSVLPECKIVVTMNSNVGMEAMMYDRHVAAYGSNVYYKHPGLVGGSIAEAGTWDKGARRRFLWHLLDKHHAVGKEIPGKMRKLVGIG